jgi:ribosome-binding factor A
MRKKRKFNSGLPCNVLLLGDGVDPKYDKKFSNHAPNRKALQLCSQVRDMLNSVLPTLGNETLNHLYIESVSPAPDSTRLLAVVDTIDDVNVVLEQLQNATGKLRIEIATVINRRKVPQLTYMVRNVQI